MQQSLPQWIVVVLQYIKNQIFGNFPIISADSAARPPLQGIKQHNGYCSCPCCFIHGEYLTDEKKMIFRYDEKVAKRTNHGYLDDAAALCQKKLDGEVKASVNGVVGLSSFHRLKKFKSIDAFVIDHMHTGFIGVLKSLTNLLIDSANSHQDYYLNPSQQKDLNSRLKQTKIPSEVNRVVRDLNDIAFWKANEWKTWCLICLPL